MSKISSLILFLSVVLFFECSKKAKSPAGNALAGKWTLIQTLADPGDGSGQWQAADTSKHFFIQFNSDKSIASNAYPGLGGLKQYNITNDSTVIFIYGNNSKFSQFYKINEPYLTLTGGCIEACGSKFIRTRTSL